MAGCRSVQHVQHTPSSPLTATRPLRDPPGSPWELPGLEEATLPRVVDIALALRPSTLPVLGRGRCDPGPPSMDPFDSRLG